MNLKHILIENIEALAVSAVVLLALSTFILQPERVSGSSMFPNIHDGERIMVDKFDQVFFSSPYTRGDIVVLRPPTNKRVHYVKRIIGVPGDIIKVLNCDVYISRDGNRFKLLEPYIPSDVCTTGGTALLDGRSIKLKDDEYIVLGDNRSNSTDSRVFGVVKSDLIVGKVIFRFYPVDRWGFI